MKAWIGCGWSVLVLGVLMAADARAAAVWPTGGWEYWTYGGVAYWDDIGDENPDATDLVGGLDDGVWYSAGATQDSIGNDQLSLRMRLDADGSGTNNVWQFLFETDGDASSIDFVLELRQNGNPASRQVVFAPTVTGGTTFGDVSIGTAVWAESIVDWSRWTAVDDGSTFGDDADFFLDVAIPRSTFLSLANLNDGDTFSVAATTSTSHNSLTKDLPVGLDDSDPVASGFADRLQSAPEPGTAGLSGMGLLWMGALHARKRRRARR